VAQLVLVVAVNLTVRDYGAFQAEEKLLVFDKQKVYALRIEDGKDSVVLHKQEGKWLRPLPEIGDFPANQGRIERLLDKLTALEKGWPVATTSGAVQRFKVAEDQFERKLTLYSKEEILAQLYAGTSPGFRKVYVRPMDEESFFSVEFNTWEASTKVDGWIDKEILNLEADELERIEMPGFVLQREEDRLQLSELKENEESNMEEVRLLLDKLTGLRIQSLLGTEAKAEYRQDQPDLEIKIVLKDGQALSYRFSKPEEAPYYVLKRSDLNHYFKIADFTAKPLLDMAREKLVQVKNKGKPTEIFDEEKQSAMIQEATE